MLGALLFPYDIFVAHTSFNLLYQFWIHTQLVPPLPLVETVFNTPSLHKIHHGRNIRALGKNYGAIFIIWDRMFGTYEPEIVEGDDEELYVALLAFESDEGTRTPAAFKWSSAGSAGFEQTGVQLSPREQHSRRQKRDLDLSFCAVRKTACFEPISALTDGARRRRSPHFPFVVPLCSHTRVAPLAHSIRSQVLWRRAAA